MVILTIDRFEDDIAVCEKEDCTIVNLLRDKLPNGVRAGNVLMLFDDGEIKINVDEEIRRKKIVFKLFSNMYNWK